MKFVRTRTTPIKMDTDAIKFTASWLLSLYSGVVILRA
jgi:hypothetical protein